MRELVFLLEEHSAKVLLEGLLQRILEPSKNISVRYIIFEGKQDLEKQLLRKLRCYNNPNAIFIILRDQDSSDCKAVKNNLQEKCRAAHRSQAIVRIACRELESWYLADLMAVEKAFDKPHLSSRQHEQKFRIPDQLASPSKELKLLVPEYQKINGSRMIAPHLDIENQRSRSFYHFVRSIKQIIGKIDG